jgi:hypothetical protein
MTLFEITNSIRASPTPSQGRRHQRNARPDWRVEHHLGLGLGNVVEADILDREFGDALIDIALVRLPAQETVTSCSSCRTWVAVPVPTMAGSPSSRLTMAAWRCARHGR